MKSFGALTRGVFLAFALGILSYSGILGPVFATFLSAEAAERAAFPAGLVVFGFSFYFGGMISGYHAPSRRRLHGVAVVGISFGLAIVVNSLTAMLIQTESDPLSNFHSAGSMVLTVILLGVSLVAAYIGAIRGKSLYEYNQKVSRWWGGRSSGRRRRG